MKGKLLPIDVEKWISGDISVEQFDVQGIFFSICCVYYKKDCLCKIVDIEKRFPNNKKELDYLYQKYIQKEGEDIKIEWVNTIFKRKQSTSSINKKNGQKGQFKKKQELTTPPLESSNTPGQPGDKTETPTIPTIKITKEEKIKKLN